MRVFVTGATGFVGSAVVRELIQAGHKVLGLVRSDAGAQALAAAGAEPLRGDLDDLDSLRRGAAAADGVIHTAFNHDFTQFKANCENDRRVVAALAETLTGTDRLLIVTSGTGLLPPGRLVTEDDAPVSGAHASPRIASEEAADAAAARGARVAVVRLAPSVHGDGDHAFVPHLIRVARETGVAAYVGDGNNRWPGVHRLDAARLYRLALEKGPIEKGGPARYHGAAEEGVKFRDIAGVIGQRLGIPVAAKSADEAAKHFGWFAHFAALDNPTSSDKTRAALGWQPSEIGLIADLDHPRYFEA